MGITIRKISDIEQKVLDDIVRNIPTEYNKKSLYGLKGFASINSYTDMLSNSFLRTFAIEEWRNNEGEKSYALKEYPKDYDNEIARLKKDSYDAIDKVAEEKKLEGTYYMQRTKADGNYFSIPRNKFDVFLIDMNSGDTREPNYRFVSSEPFYNSILIIELYHMLVECINNINQKLFKIPNAIKFGYIDTLNELYSEVDDSMESLFYHYYEEELIYLSIINLYVENRKYNIQKLICDSTPIQRFSFFNNLDERLFQDIETQKLPVQLERLHLIITELNKCFPFLTGLFQLAKSNYLPCESFFVQVNETKVDESFQLELDMSVLQRHFELLKAIKDILKIVSNVRVAKTKLFPEIYLKDKVGFNYKIRDEYKNSSNELVRDYWYLYWDKNTIGAVNQNNGTTTTNQNNGTTTTNQNNGTTTTNQNNGTTQHHNIKTTTTSTFDLGGVLLTGGISFLVVKGLELLFNPKKRNGLFVAGRKSTRLEKLIAYYEKNEDLECKEVKAKIKSYLKKNNYKPTEQDKNILESENYHRLLKIINLLEKEKVTK